MAASPLDEVNWDNLQAAEMTTAINLLMRATQERYIIAQARANGTIVSSQEPKPRYFPVGDPIKQPTLVHYGKPGEPLACPTFNVKDLLVRCSIQMTDITRVEGIVGTSRLIYDSTDKINIARLSGAPDDPLTFLTRMHELAGVPGLSDVPGPGYAYPDMSSGAPEEIKKWYDLLTVLEWVLYFDRQAGSDYRIMQDIPNETRLRGEFDPTINGLLFANGIDGASMYGTEGFPITTDETNYLDFKTGHDLLLGGGRKDWFSRVDNPTELFEPTNQDRYHLFVEYFGGTEYQIRLKAFQLQYQLDWSGLHSTWNLSGMPRNPRRVQALSINDNNVSTGVASPVQIHANDILYLPDLTMTDTGINTQTADIDDQIVKTVLPATSSGFGSGKFDFEITQPRFLDMVFMDWNYEGGYVYYIS